MVLGPWIGVNGSISYFRMTLFRGWGRRTRGVLRGLRILVDGFVVLGYHINYLHGQMVSFSKQFN